MDLFHDRSDRFEDFRMFIDPFLADDTDKRDQTGYEQTDVVVFPVLVESPDVFDEAGFSFPLYHVCAFHRHHDPVFDLYISDLPGLKEGFISCVHRVLLFFTDQKFLL